MNLDLAVLVLERVNGRDVAALEGPQGNLGTSGGDGETFVNVEGANAILKLFLKEVQGIERER